MLDRFERFSYAISEISRCWHKLATEELAQKKVVDGSLYRGLWVLTAQGKKAAQEISLRAGRAVELAGKDLTEETREVFYQALESITANLTELTKEGIPE